MPLRPPARTALTDHWDRILAAEGLQPIRPGYQTSGAPLDTHRWVSLSDHEEHEYAIGSPDPDTDYWRPATIWDDPRSIAATDRVSAAEALIARFPPDNGRRQWAQYIPFFRRWAETGRVRQSALDVGITPSQAHRWLDRLRQHFAPQRAKRKPHARPGTMGGVSYYASRAHLPTPWIARYTRNGEGVMVGKFATEGDARAAVIAHRARSISAPANDNAS